MTFEKTRKKGREIYLCKTVLFHDRILLGGDKLQSALVALSTIDILGRFFALANSLENQLALHGSVVFLDIYRCCAHLLIGKTATTIDLLSLT